MLGRGCWGRSVNTQRRGSGIGARLVTTLATSEEGCSRCQFGDHDGQTNGSRAVNLNFFLTKKTQVLGRRRLLTVTQVAHR